jgi:hypothetical protein
MAQHCPECGAELRAGRACVDDFHQLLAWESEFPPLGEVHHLMVLAYHLQHPSLYSPQGLAEARKLLDQFVGQGASPQDVRRRNRAKLNSSNRDWKITGRPGARGSYGRDMPWTMRAADVVAGGPEHYIDNVRTWALGIREVLK